MPGSEISPTNNYQPGHTGSAISHQELHDSVVRLTTISEQSEPRFCFSVAYILQSPVGASCSTPSVVMIARPFILHTESKRAREVQRGIGGSWLHYFIVVFNAYNCTGIRLSLECQAGQIRSFFAQ